MTERDPVMATVPEAIEEYRRGKFVIITDAGAEYATFDRANAEIAKAAMIAHARVEIDAKTSQYGFECLAIRRCLADPPADPDDDQIPF